MTGGSSPWTHSFSRRAIELVRIHIMQMQFQDQYIRPRARAACVAHDSKQLLAGFGNLGTPAERTRHGDQALGCVTARVGDEDFQAACAERGIDVVRDSKGHLDPEGAAHPDAAA